MAHYVTRPASNPQADPSDQYIDQIFDQRTIARGSEWDARLDSTYTFGADSIIKDFVLGYRISDRSAHNTGSFGGAFNCITNPNPALEYNPFIIAANASAICSGANGYVTQGSGGAGGSTPQSAAINYTHIGGYALTLLGSDAYSHTSGLFFGGQFGESGWTNISPEWLWNNIGTIRTLFGYGAVDPKYITEGRPDSPASLFIVSEVSNAAYLKVDYGFDLMGLPGGRQFRRPLRRYHPDRTGEQLDGVRRAC